MRRYEIGRDVTESFTLSPTYGLEPYWTRWGRSRGKVDRNGMGTTLERFRDEGQAAGVVTRAPLGAVPARC